MTERIAAVLIVRNEAANIVRCLDAAKPLIATAVIDDTGSTDGTQRIVADWGEKNGVEVSLRERPWENFKVNRTALMERAAPFGDWLLLQDADMVLHHPEPFPALDGADSWHGRVDFNGLDYTLPMLVRASKPWYFEGVAHSYLACRDDFGEATLPGLWVEDHSHTSVEKLERDLIALSQEHAAYPLDRRTVFYLAQTYYDLDRFGEAAHYYRMRSEMGGWDEEVYFARYRLGCLMVEHFNFAEGAKILLRAWEGKPNRAEALRALAGSATSVANKLPKPTDRLFVGTRSYETHDLPRPLRETRMPPFPDIAPRRRRRPRVTKTGLDPRDVTAIVVTRGDQPEAVEEILASLPFDDAVVYDNAKRPVDYKAFGRYAAIPEARNPVIFWVDDDVVFSAFDALLAAYEPGKLVCNMDESWIDGAGYRGLVGMQGAGSLCDASLPRQVWARYLAEHPWDDDALVEADFVFGTLVPFTVVDLGYEVRGFADAADRLYRQPGQTERKHKMIARCRAMLDR